MKRPKYIALLFGFIGSAMTTASFFAPIGFFSVLLLALGGLCVVCGAFAWLCWLELKGDK